MGCTATQLFASFRSNPLNESFVSPGVSPGGVIVVSTMQIPQALRAVYLFLSKWDILKPLHNDVDERSLLKGATAMWGPSTLTGQSTEGTWTGGLSWRSSHNQSPVKNAPSWSYRTQGHWGQKGSQSSLSPNCSYNRWGNWDPHNLILSNNHLWYWHAIFHQFKTLAFIF